MQNVCQRRFAGMAKVQVINHPVIGVVKYFAKISNLTLFYQLGLHQNINISTSNVAELYRFSRQGI